MAPYSTFKPAWWLSNPHLQTIYPALIRRPRLAQPRLRQRLELDDGDFLDLDCMGEATQPLVLLLHGLAGDSHSGYILGLQNSLYLHGFASVVMNFRGCSGEFNRLARAYHAGETADLNAVFSHLQRQYPGRSLSVVGFSLGGNMVLKWLGERGGIPGLSAAVAVSVPFRLDRCASRLDQGLSRLYSAYLLRDLKKFMQAKYHSLRLHGHDQEAEKIQALGDLRSIRSFWEYDDRVVAPLHGFHDVHDYYAQSSCISFLSSIANACLVIQASDDPFMTADVIPESQHISSLVQLELLKAGGHVGFIAGHRPFCAEYWLEKRIVAFLQANILAG